MSCPDVVFSCVSGISFVQFNKLKKTLYAEGLSVCRESIRSTMVVTDNESIGNGKCNLIKVNLVEHQHCWEEMVDFCFIHTTVKSSLKYPDCVVDPQTLSNTSWLNVVIIY